MDRRSSLLPLQGITASQSRAVLRYGWATTKLDRWWDRKWKVRLKPGQLSATSFSTSLPGKLCSERWGQELIHCRRFGEQCGPSLLFAGEVLMKSWELRIYRSTLAAGGVSPCSDGACADLFGGMLFYRDRHVPAKAADLKPGSTSSLHLFQCYRHFLVFFFFFFFLFYCKGNINFTLGLALKQHSPPCIPMWLLLQARSCRAPSQRHGDASPPHLAPRCYQPWLKHHLCGLYCVAFPSVLLLRKLRDKNASAGSCLGAVWRLFLMGTQLHGDSDLSKRQHQDLGFTTASCFILFYELITHIRSPDWPIWRFDIRSLKVFIKNIIYAANLLRKIFMLVLVFLIAVHS